MVISSIYNVENKKVVSNIKFEHSGCIGNILDKFIPVIINGIYTSVEISNLLPKLEKCIWIEPYNTQNNASRNILDNIGLYEPVTSMDFTKSFLLDIKLTNYEAILINNFHSKDVYTDLLISNLKYVQSQRQSSNLPLLKIILLTYPLPIDVLINIFDNSAIFNLHIKCNDQSLTLETDFNPVNYMEAVFKTIYMLFMNKIEGLNTSMNTNNLKVLVFLADSSDVNTAYKWLSSRLVSMINAYIVVVDNMKKKKNLTDYPSLLVLTCTTDKTVLQSLNVEFDYVIDSGLISTRRLNKTSRVDCMILEKVNIAESLVRSSYICNPLGKNIQLYSLEDQNLLSPVDSSSYFKIRHSVTDFLFCQIALGRKSWENYSTLFMYFHLSLKYSIDNLVKSKLIVKTNDALQISNSHSSKVLATIWNYELTELGQSCLKLRPQDCQTACVLLSALKNECFLSCLTLVSLLQVSDSLFIDLYGHSDHLENLKTIYDGKDDLGFLLAFYRHYVSLNKNERTSLLKNFSINKVCFTNASKIRANIKENFPFPISSKTGTDLITNSFVSAYPNQIAKYSDVEKVYMTPGPLKSAMLIDPYSFAFDQINPLPFVFYYSTYTENSKVYIKYVSPISKEIWDEFSVL